MRSFYTVTSDITKKQETLGRSERLSVYYHDLFDYPLTFADLIKWGASENLLIRDRDVPVVSQNGYYFLQGREGLIYKRVFRARISAKKMEIARKSASVLSLIPSVKMVAVTGSLAMDNAEDESDIDLFVVTGKNLLWTTRILSYLTLKVFGFDLRKAGNKNQKDKLCLNMWMDEADLAWRKNDRNLYTAHEIAQVLPLVNKNGTYERFLQKNRWILRFWPNAVRIGKFERESKKHISGTSLLIILVEKIAFWFQYQHMKAVITKEVVTPSRAIFHPQDLGRLVISRLAS
jgi:predicted nucleotidyltransferase